jgi:hypothetical protein
MEALRGLLLLLSEPEPEVKHETASAFSLCQSDLRRLVKTCDVYTPLGESLLKALNDTRRMRAESELLG